LPQRSPAFRSYGVTWNPANENTVGRTDVRRHYHRPRLARGCGCHSGHKALNPRGLGTESSIQRMPRPENLRVPPVSGKYGRHSNRIGKPHCFKGFRVAINMLRPALGSPAEPAWHFRVADHLFQGPFSGWRLAGDRCPLRDHLRTGQRNRAQNIPVPVQTSSVQSPSDASCSAPTSGRAQNASCFSFLERFLFCFSEGRRGEAPARCRRVYSHRLSHEFPRRASFQPRNGS